MKILVTGSADHLGEALMRTLRAEGAAVLGIDRLASPSPTAWATSVMPRSCAR
jgi:UDP-glucose 4-epimerase